MTKKVYVITGGSSGIGKAAALRLGKQGIVLLSSSRAEKLEQAAAELKAEGITDIMTQVVDVANEAHVNALAAEAESLGELGAIVHSAGVSPTMGDARTLMTVNAIGTGYVLKAFLPLARPGSVAVCIASMAGYYVPRNPEYTSILTQPLEPDFLSRMDPFIKVTNDAYCLSKLGVMLMVENQAWDWSEQGARIVSISPGLVDTPMGRQEAEQQASVGKLVNVTPLRRICTADEIAAIVEFLCSSESSYITGADIRADGGLTAHVTVRMNQQPNG